MSNPSCFGGFLKCPPGVDERHVLLRDGTFLLQTELRRADPRIERYGGGMLILLGSGQFVPVEGIPA